MDLETTIDCVVGLFRGRLLGGGDDSVSLFLYHFSRLTSHSHTFCCAQRPCQCAELHQMHNPCLVLVMPRSLREGYEAGLLVAASAALNSCTVQWP